MWSRSDDQAGRLNPRAQSLAEMLNLLNSVKLLHFLIAVSSEEHLNTVKASLMGAEVKKTRPPLDGGHKE